MSEMPFHHKNIRLRPENYTGKTWSFITLCCANRHKLFITAKFCDWFLSILRHDAATHSFAVHADRLMPDHAHLLVEGLDPTSDLLLFVKALKTKTSTAFERRTGHPLWQKKFSDHVLRRNDSPDAVSWYIWMNPVRAGFCHRPEEYRFLGSFTGAWSKTYRPSSDWSPPWQKTKAPPTVQGRYTSRR